MHKHLNQFKRFLAEARDPSYEQETFYFRALVSLRKDLGGNREETKNDVRAIPEVLTVSNIDPPDGVQRDIGTKYLSTWKIHVRLPRTGNREELMRLIVNDMNNLRGCNVVQFKMLRPSNGGAAARPYGAEVELEEAYGENYQDSPERKRRNRAALNITKKGPNKGGPFKPVTDDPNWGSSPPGAPGGGSIGTGLEEGDSND
jgi:hypothetical protein